MGTVTESVLNLVLLPSETSLLLGIFLAHLGREFGGSDGCINYIDSGHSVPGT